MTDSIYVQNRARLEATLRLLFAVLTGCVAGIGLLAITFSAFGMNQLWLLYAGGRLLSGAPIYGTEIMESNPPFIIWLSAVPAALSRAFHQPPAFGFRIFLVVLSAGVLVWCLGLLRRLLPSSGSTTAATSPLLWAFSAAFTVVALCVAPTGFAGEREHFLVLFVLPYLFVSAMRLQARSTGRVAPWEAFAAGVFAAVGICCKPQHLLIVVGIEFALLLLRRNFKSIFPPEFVAVVLGGVAYLLSVQLFAPRYFHQVIPLMVQTYWAYGGVPFHAMMVQKRSLLLLGIAFIGAAACYRLRRKLRLAPLVYTLVLSSVCSMVAYFIQGTGFPYQIIPTISFLLIAYAMLIADVIVPAAATSAKPSGRTSPQFFKWSPAAAAVIVFAITVIGLHGHFRAKAAAFHRVDPDTERILASYPSGTPVYLMATDPGMFPEIVDHDFVWGSRFLHLWMLPAIVRAEQHAPDMAHRLTPAQVEKLTVEQHAFMVQDLQHWEPALVAIERCDDPSLESCEGMTGRHFNLLQWFTNDPAFAAEWSNYRFIKTAGRYDYYQSREYEARRSRAVVAEAKSGE